MIKFLLCGLCKPGGKLYKFLYISLPEEAAEKVEITDEILELRNEYMKAKILGPEWIDDATHVAVATVARADAIVG